MRIQALFYKSLAIVALVLTALVFGPVNSQAETVQFTGTNATGITDLSVDGVLYDVTFYYATGISVYDDPGEFIFRQVGEQTEELSYAASLAIQNALMAAPSRIYTVGPNKSPYFYMATYEDQIDGDPDAPQLYLAWESRYNVVSDVRDPDIWTFADNWNPNIDIFSGEPDISGFLPFGVAPPLSRVTVYSFVNAVYAGDTPPPSETVGGDVTGLVGSGLVLLNKGADNESIIADGPFVFNTPITQGAGYSVTVGTQPSGPAQECYVSQGSGSVHAGGVSNVLVTCADVPVQNPAANPLAGNLFATDFDGDSEADAALYTVNSGQWVVINSSGGTKTTTFGGQSVDLPVAADYDGDGFTDLAFFRNGQWKAQLSSGGTFGTAYGLAGDVPVPADFDGDGTSDVAFFRNGQWKAQLSGGGTTGTAYGLAGDVPVAADYDGDGTSDVAIFRDGKWKSQLSSGGVLNIGFGVAGDLPVQGDYDGDGITDVAIYRNGLWRAQYSGGGSLSVTFGTASDVPVPADYDGDGRTDPAVYDPATNGWRVQPSNGGQVQSGTLGGDASSIPANPVALIIMRFIP